jgi:glycerate dehydrogenase
VLSLITHLEEYRSFVSGGEYTARGLANSLTPVYHEIAGKKWGVVGYGNIGKRVAAIAEVFGAEVLVCKRTPEDGVRVVDIDTLCAECDIITVHTPLTEATRGMLGERQLSVMKNTAILVNAARGAVLDEAAIASAVKDGRIGAFGSDVYSSEPFSKEHPFYEIKDYKNVCLTPHAAWAAYEARVRCLEVICNNIKGYLSNKIINSVNNL